MTARRCKQIQNNSFSTKDALIYYGFTGVDKVDIWINKHATHWTHCDYILGYYKTNSNDYIIHIDLA